MDRPEGPRRSPARWGRFPIAPFRAREWSDAPTLGRLDRAWGATRFGVAGETRDGRGNVEPEAGARFTTRSRVTTVHAATHRGDQRTEKTMRAVGGKRTTSRSTHAA